MRPIVPFLIASPPAVAVDSGHGGVVRTRSNPEASDIAVFACAVIGVWLVRRALRARFAKRAAKKD